jgi:hypothetical protein
MKRTTPQAATLQQAVSRALRAAQLGVIQCAAILTLCLASAAQAQEAAPVAVPANGTEGTNSSWIDPELLNRATNQFATVMDFLKRASELTNNVEADKVLDQAQAALHQISQEDLDAMLTGMSTLLQSHRAEAEALRKKSAEPGLSPELARKYAQLAKDWQGVIASLDLKGDEIKAIQNDLGKFLKSFDQERDFWRARIRFASAKVLDQEIGKFIQNLREIRDRLSTSLAQDETPKTANPRPQISAGR